MSILKVNRIESLQGQPIELGQTVLSGSFTGDGSQLTGVVSSSYSTTSSFSNEVPFDNITGKPTLVSGSDQINLNQISGTTFGNSSFTFPQNVTVQGSITSQEFYSEYVSSSILYESGSTKFGDSLDDVHSFTGSLQVLGGITGSLLATNGILSSSAQITSEISGAFTSISQSIASDVTGLDGRLDTLEGKTLVSGSSQISYLGITDVPVGIVSGSFQVTSLLPAGTISGSTQIDVTLTQKYITLATTGSNTFTSNQIVSGSISVTNQVLSNTGSLTLPGLSVIGDTNTGIYFPGADTIGFVEGGVEAMTINSSGNVIVSGSLLIKRAHETIVTSATAATGTINFDALTQPILYYTSNASGNWTLNVRGDASTTLNNTMEIGRALTIVFMVTNGATPYRQTGFTVDGSAVTPKWQGGSAPAAGNANSVDSYAVTIMKTANATFSVFESQTRFA